MNIDEIKMVLAAQLKPSRFEHSLGVMKTAGQLAERYGVSREQAELAGLLHDCARIYKNDELADMAEQAGIIADEVEQAAPLLLHAPLGAVLAAERFGVSDAAILEAIRLHTTGGAVMTVLDKIIYLADMIEPKRIYPEVDRLREVSVRGLDEAMLLAFDQSIKYVVARGQLVHLDTIRARNAIILGRLKDAEKA